MAMISSRHSPELSREAFAWAFEGFAVARRRNCRRERLSPLRHLPQRGEVDPAEREARSRIGWGALVESPYSPTQRGTTMKRMQRASLAIVAALLSGSALAASVGLTTTVAVE